MRLTLILSGLIIFNSGCSKFEVAREGGLTQALGARVNTIKWIPNRDLGVNADGGGYRVSFSKGTTISSDAKVIEVPFKNGRVENSVVVSFPSAGAYRIRVTAYSAINPQGSSSEVDYNVK